MRRLSEQEQRELVFLRPLGGDEPSIHRTLHGRRARRRPRQEAGRWMKALPGLRRDPAAAGVHQLVQHRRPGAPQTEDEERVGRHASRRHPLELCAPVELEQQGMPSQPQAIAERRAGRRAARADPVRERTAAEQRLEGGTWRRGHPTITARATPPFRIGGARDDRERLRAAGCAASRAPVAARMPRATLRSKGCAGCGSSRCPHRCSHDGPRRGGRA